MLTVNDLAAFIVVRHVESAHCVAKPRLAHHVVADNAARPCELLDPFDGALTSRVITPVAPNVLGSRRRGLVNEPVVE
jgi:hypothetical protein